MTSRDALLSRFSGGGDPRPLWAPDLIAWYNWRLRAGTLPEHWRSSTLADVCRDLGAPVWSAARPWRVETPGVAVRSQEADGERTVTAETARGTLVARWSVGPDGDWWQTEYPVKTADDLPAARELVESREYVVDSTEWDRLDASVGDAGVVALELPRRPYSEVLHTLLGWTDGLMLMLGDGREAIVEMLAVLEAKVQACVRQASRLDGALAYSPDNLDAQFVSPGVFREHLSESYRLTAGTLHATGKRLVVHAGGPVRRLLAPLAAVGVDGVEGIAGAPQGDATLAQARAAAGPALTLWGGIPQDYLLPAYGAAEFEDAVRAAARQAVGDGRMLLGVADQVPVGADPERLRAISALVASA